MATQHRPRILIVKAGTAAPEIVREHGDYDQWFIRAMGEPTRFSVVEAFLGKPLPDPAGFDGVIVTGSPLSVCDPSPWMQTAGAKLREWVEGGRAVLGVCFGHQLLSHAFGTPVIKNPNGREIGTIEVALTPEGASDLLFEGLGSSLVFQATHTDIPSEVPAGTRLLATNANTVAQALWFGRRARGVQFHPEMSPATMRSLLRSRREILAREGIDGEARERAVLATETGVELLRRFEERFAGA
jgi:GMP synthase (glutamine-hydrolysing)